MSQVKGFVILRRIRGLGEIKFHRRPQQYLQEIKDRETDGEHVGEWGEEVLPGGSIGLMPHWNSFKDAYCWGGTDTEMKELVAALKLRYPPTWSEPNQRNKIIQPEDVDPTLYEDPFFRHDKLQMLKMENGKIVLDQSKPLHRFLTLSYKGNPQVIVRDGNPQATYLAGAALYEMIFPNIQKAVKKSEIDKKVEANALLGSMSFDKQKLIAQIMRLTDVDLKNPDPDLLLISLNKNGVDNEGTSLRWGGKSGRDRFVELAKEDNDVLVIMATVSKGIEYRIITKGVRSYEFDMDVLEGVDDDVKLFHYFRQDGNHEKYLKLLDIIKEKDIQLYGDKRE